MKNYIGLFCCILLGCSACHPNSGGNPANLVWGDLVATKTTADSADRLLTGEKVEAAFYSAGNPAWNITVNSVSANGTLLLANYYHQYSAAADSGIRTHVLWSVSGGTSVPSFSYNDVGSLPTYSGPGLPDTIARTSAFSMTFPLSTLTDADSVMITFGKISRATTRLYTKTIDINRNVSYTARDMSQLDTGANVGSIVVTKTSNQVFGGKLFHFTKARAYQYRVIVK